jgi:predicted RNA binding protein YcfA (HicA-like mRNA interferase family)
MSNTTPILKPKEIIKILCGLGFEFHRQSGSHRIYVKENLQVIIPFHNKDLKKGTITQIIKVTGLTNEEFKKLI